MERQRPQLTNDILRDAVEAAIVKHKGGGNQRGGGKKKPRKPRKPQV